MNNHQNTTFHQLGYFIKTCRSPAGTGFNKITNSAKSVILLIIPIYAKVSISLLEMSANSFRNALNEDHIINEAKNIGSDVRNIVIEKIDKTPKSLPVEEKVQNIKK